MTEIEPTPSERAASYDETPIAPADVESAGRSCSVIIVLLAVLVLVLCIGLAGRYIVLR
ncbi:MAG TPA: hypothetical protein VFQ80_00250 [Thermomicrobiales bacterium]|jgi:hypothetical protein|nr:hypothetical protein [Thermomicrobiales bacterium]